MSEMWESVSGAWERNAEFVDAHLASATALLLDAAHVAAGSAVIDVACGPGGAGLAAAQRVTETGSVILADVAPGMAAAAGRRTEQLPQVSTLVCDETALDVPEASLDAVICRHGLMFVDPPEAAVREAARVLRPGGWYATMTWDARAANPWLGVLLDAVGEQFGMTFPPPSVKGPFSLDEPEALAGVLRGGGLSAVEVTRVGAPFAIDSLDVWWGRVPELAGPLAVALAGMEPDVRAAIRDRSLAAGQAASSATAGGVEFAGSVLIAAGRRD